MELRRSGFLVVLVIASALVFAQQSNSSGVVATDELQKVVPANYFYRGKSATVQVRNSGAIRTKDDKYVIAALVDTAGYASDIAQKYQGLFISEVKVKVEGSQLSPGQYGFGFIGDKFVVTDVGANDVTAVSSKRDNKLKHPVPLKIAEEGGEYRLYAGKKYVTLHVE